MRCRRCREEMEAREVPGFNVRYVCVTPGCPKGAFPRMKGDEHPLDLTKEQIRTKVKKLLAMAGSAFPEEADTAKQLAQILIDKYGL